MTLLIKLENERPVGFPVAEENFRQIFPSTSFPKFLTSEDVAPFGYGIYDFSNQPDVKKYHKAVEADPVKSDVGIWRQAWHIVEMSDQEKAQADSKEADLVRARRDSLLAATDWTVVVSVEKGISISQEMAAYRQSLRDITNHVNFPYLADGDWPVKP